MFLVILGYYEVLNTISKIAYAKNQNIKYRH